MTITTSSRNPWTWALSRYCYQLSNAAPASQNRFTISQLLLTSWGYVHTMKVIKEHSRWAQTCLGALVDSCAFLQQVCAYFFIHKDIVFRCVHEY